MTQQKVLVFFLVSFTFVFAHPFDWEIERVDTVGEVGNYPSLKLDSLGHPHIAYGDMTTKATKYTWWDGAQWHFDTIEIGLGDTICGITPSLEFDSLGRPCICYQCWPHALHYAWWDGNDWVIEVVDTIGFTGFGCNLEFDKNWNPHIAYSNTDPFYDLRYAIKQGAGWELYLVDSLGQTGYGVSFVLDDNDTAHISYQKQFEGILKYAKGTPQSWQISVVDSGPQVGSTSSLALDGQRYPHISYGDYSVMSDMDLRYAKYNGVDWEIEEVDTFDRVGFYSSIDIDRYDRPHISYCDDLGHLGYNLKYAYWTGTEWYIEKVDSAGGDVGWQSSLLMDEGNAFIAYRDREYADLKYAKARIFGIEENTSFSTPNTGISLICSPNPLSATTKISFGIETSDRATISLQVYDITGRMVKNLIYAQQINKGEIVWQGDDDNGYYLSNGLYFVVLKYESENTHGIHTDKVVILRH